MKKRGQKFEDPWGRWEVTRNLKDEVRGDGGRGVQVSFIDEISLLNPPAAGFASDKLLGALLRMVELASKQQRVSTA